MYWFLLADLGLLFLLLVQFRRQKKKTDAGSEYWVYLKSGDLPNQSQLMQDLFARKAISNQEAMLFSDVRLNIIHVLRSKNPALFHPEQFEESVPAADPIWIECAAAHSLAIVKFTHAKPDSDTRYLRLLPNLAYAIAKYSDGIGILDVDQRQLFSTSEFERRLEKSSEAEGCDFNVRIHWQEFPFCEAHTWGLSKIGMKELTTGPIESDFRTLAGHLLLQSAEAVWKKKGLPEVIELNEYGSMYKLIPDKGGKKLLDGRIKMRIFQVKGQ